MNRESKKQSRAVKAIRGFFNRDHLIPLCILVLICVVTGALNPVFFTWTTWQNILMQVSNVGVIALGAMFVVTSGGLDFTAGDGVSLAGVCAALVFVASGHNTILTILAGILAGSLMGCVTGMVVTKLKIQPFVATLAMMTIIKGVMLLISEGTIIHLDVPGTNFIKIGQGIVPVFGAGRGIPVAFLIFVFMAIVAAVLLHKTRFGQAVLALGGNEEAARLNGVKVNMYRFLVFVVASTFTGVGAVITLARVGTIGINLGGTTLLMNVMAAVVIGGTSPSGGKCNVFGIIMGTFIVTCISSMLTYMNVDTNWRDVFKGLIILAALVIDAVANHLSEVREAKAMAALKLEAQKKAAA